MLSIVSEERMVGFNDDDQTKSKLLAMIELCYPVDIVLKKTNLLFKPNYSKLQQSICQTHTTILFCRYNSSHRCKVIYYDVRFHDRGGRNRKSKYDNSRVFIDLEVTFYSPEMTVIVSTKRLPFKGWNRRDL